MNPTISDEIMALRNMSDNQIDTSDIPKIVDWESVPVGRFYRKTNTITIQVDSDVLAWLELHHYQDKINDILRHLMRHNGNDKRTTYTRSDTGYTGAKVMARYEHLPIYRAAFDLAVHIEKIVHRFSRYHKYSLGTELRDSSRRILERIIEANSSQERESILSQLRIEVEKFKVLVCLCHESGGFASTRAYLYISEQVVNISKQNEGWLRQITRIHCQRLGKAGHGPNQKG